MIKDNIIKQTSILTDIRNLLQSARTNVLKQVNFPGNQETDFLLPSNHPGPTKIKQLALYLL